MDRKCWREKYSQSSAPTAGLVPAAPGPTEGAAPTGPGCPPARPPVFLLRRELKKLARTPSLVVAAPGFTALGSI